MKSHVCFLGHNPSSSLTPPPQTMQERGLLTTRTEQHSTKVRESYARFLMVVLSAYQQMRNQKQPVLSEVGEDNFDRAFKFLKPGE